MCYNIAIKVGQRVATVEYAPYHILTTFIFMLIGEANIMKRKTHEEYVFEVSQINPFIEVIGKYAGNHIKILHKCKIGTLLPEYLPTTTIFGLIFATSVTY